jgi:hypothetical protein
MSKLILHVGTHKTGTTTIQDTFALNREFLAEKGIVFPQIGNANGQHGLVMDWITLPNFYHLETTSEEAWVKLAKNHARSDRTVLISTEELSRGSPGARVDLRRLRDLVSNFDEVKVVCCLRNQVSFIQSIYLQVVKSSVNIPWLTYFDGTVRGRMATGLFLDYSDLKSYLQTGFSPEEISFFSYEREVKSSQGIVGRMMSECGLENFIGSMIALPAGHSNVSPDPLATWAAAHVLGPRPFKPWLVGVAREALYEICRTEARTTLFSREEYRKVRDTYSPLNEKFNKDEADRGMDSVIGSFPDESGLIFRDSLTPAFWVTLSRQIVDKLDK